MLRFFDSRSWLDVDYWALDLETSGLRPRDNVICSAAMVPIRQGTIRWGERRSWLIDQPRDHVLSPSAIAIHHLIPDELRNGLALAEVYSQIVELTRDHVLIVHHKALDWGFLQAAAKTCALPPLTLPIVDTVVLLQHLNQRRAWLKTSPLPYNLSAARAAFELPTYPQHDALADALACAELFLVLRQRLGLEKLRELT